MGKFNKPIKFSRSVNVNVKREKGETVMLSQHRPEFCFVFSFNLRSITSATPGFLIKIHRFWAHS